MAAIALAKAIGREDFATAIKLMRAELLNSADDALHLAFISQCHWWLGEEDKAIEVAGEALERHANCHEAHRILASLYVQRRDHTRGLLHTQNAVRTFRPALKLPAWVIMIVMRLIRLVRGRAVANDSKEGLSNIEKDERLWLEWAQRYVIWNKDRGTLSASNDDFPLVPRTRR